MAPRNRQATPATTSTSASSTPLRTKASSQNANANLGEAQQIINGVWKNYVDRTPQRVKLIDAFMGFLVVVGALQFLYCVIVGNFVRLFPLCTKSGGFANRDGLWSIL
jgi:oligosaccharyltransferase complex subunit epsilon